LHCLPALRLGLATARMRSSSAIVGLSLGEDEARPWGKRLDEGLELGLDGLGGLLVRRVKGAVKGPF
jgi:hypothetical protein